MREVRWPRRKEREDWIAFASREIAEHHLNKYFEMVEAQLTGS
jgi:hypothetical protein